ITLQMSIGIVKLFEIIDIDQEGRHRPAKALCPRPLSLNLVKESSTIGHPRETVNSSHFLQFAIHARQNPQVSFNQNRKYKQTQTQHIGIITTVFDEIGFRWACHNIPLHVSYQLKLALIKNIIPLIHIRSL